MKILVISAYPNNIGLNFAITQNVLDNHKVTESNLTLYCVLTSSTSETIYYIYMNDFFNRKKRTKFLKNSQIYSDNLGC